MAVVSSDVLWELVRNHNSFAVRKGDKDFSTDPYNLLNSQRQKYAGIATNTGVGVTARSKKEDPVVLRLKKLRKNQPKKNHHEEKVVIKRGGYAGNARNALKAYLAARNPTLVEAGVKRMNRLHSADLKKAISRKA